MRTLGACSGDLSHLLRSCATLVVKYLTCHILIRACCSTIKSSFALPCCARGIVRRCKRNSLAWSWALTFVRVQVEITFRDNCYGEGNDPFSEPPQLCGEDFYDGNPINNYQPDQFTGV